jgi:hypothetical protein
MLMTRISYLIYIPHTESCRLTNGREVLSFSWSSHSPFSPSSHTSWFVQVDVWDRYLLVVNEASHGPGAWGS